MPEFFWSVLRVGGYLALFLVALVVALVVAFLALIGAWLVIDWRRQRAKDRAHDEDNAAMHEKIQAYLRQQATAQEEGKEQ